MKVVIATPALSTADAVGHDIIEERICLQEEGIDVAVYAERYSHETTSIVNSDALDFLKDKSSLLIYHHTSYWKPVEELLKQVKGRVVIKYHNITPAYFFFPYSHPFALLCLMGRFQTAAFARMKSAFLFADSLFNAGDFVNEGFPKENIRIVPPFHRIHELSNTKPDRLVVDRLRQSGKLNILFVGRVSPNKGHRHIICTSFYYRLLFGENIHFFVVGNNSFLKSYTKELNALLVKLHLKDFFTFAGIVSEPELKAYYCGSQVFLCLSEHEGFCVPLLELTGLEKSAAVLLSESPVRWNAGNVAVASSSSPKTTSLLRGLP
jgi:glycosyltransferase involved in cell wall biosynthesis